MYFENSPAFMNSCAFRSLGVTPDGEPLEAGENIYGPVYSTGLNGTLALRNCTVQNTFSEHPISLRHQDVYSDNPMHKVLHLQLLVRARLSTTKDSPRDK